MAVYVYDLSAAELAQVEGGLSFNCRGTSNIVGVSEIVIT
jgi:hypothetical protein